MVQFWRCSGFRSLVEVRANRFGSNILHVQTWSIIFLRVWGVLFKSRDINLWCTPSFFLGPAKTITNKDHSIPFQSVPVLAPPGAFACFSHRTSEHKNSVVSLNHFARQSRGNSPHKHLAPDSNRNKEKSNSLPADCYFLRQRCSWTDAGNVYKSVLTGNVGPSHSYNAAAFSRLFGRAMLPLTNACSYITTLYYSQVFGLLITPADVHDAPLVRQLWLLLECNYGWV